MTLPNESHEQYAATNPAPARYGMSSSFSNQPGVHQSHRFGFLSSDRALSDSALPARIDAPWLDDDQILNERHSYPNTSPFGDSSSDLSKPTTLLPSTTRSNSMESAFSSVGTASLYATESLITVMPDVMATRKEVSTRLRTPLSPRSSC
jgi:hypothetical protein